LRRRATPQLYLHFDRLDGERISLEGAFDGDVVSGVGDEGVGVGDLVDLVANDEDGGGASLDALGSAVGAIFVALGGAHGIGDEALEGLGVSACGSKGEGEGGDSCELFHERPTKFVLSGIIGLERGCLRRSSLARPSLTRRFGGDSEATPDGLATQLLAGELCTLDSSADFLERSVSGSRGIVGEGCETAVIGCS
jgi:hypothetical protein